MSPGGSTRAVELNTLLSRFGVACVCVWGGVVHSLNAVIPLAKVNNCGMKRKKKKSFFCGPMSVRPHAKSASDHTQMPLVSLPRLVWLGEFRGPGGWGLGGCTRLRQLTSVFSNKLSFMPPPQLTARWPFW